MHQQRRQILDLTNRTAFLFKCKPLEERFKWCFSCKERKTLDLFKEHTAMRDGFLDKCEPCRSTEEKVAQVTPNNRVNQRSLLFNKCQQDLKETFIGIPRGQRRDMARILQKTHWKKYQQEKNGTVYS